MQEQNYDRWIGGAETNSNGVAKFNVPVDLQGRNFKVEVEAPWNQRNLYSRATYGPLTYEDLNEGEFALGTPNLVLTIKQKNKVSAASWSGIGVEEVDPNNSNSFVNWVTGTGTDQNGVAALTLDANKTFRITVYPGPESQGSRLSCVFATDAEGVVSKVDATCGGGGSVINKAITLELSPGNVTGKVYRPGGAVPLAGAIVFAEAYDAETDSAIAGLTAEAVTDKNGDYGLDLDRNYNWKIKVFYVNLPGELSPMSSYLTPETVTSVELSQQEVLDGTPIAVNFTLAPRGS